MSTFPSYIGGTLTRWIIVMHEIELKLKGESHEESDELDQLRHRVEETEKALHEKARHREKLMDLLSNKHPKVRRVTEELEELEIALKESIEELEHREKEMHEKEAKAFTEEVFGRIEEVEERMEGLEEKLEEIIRMLKDRD